MTKKVALYGRVSTKNQKLDDQEDKLVSWAEEEGYEDYDLLTERVSSVKERPKFNEIMNNLDRYDIFAVTDLDRFGRSTRDILAQVDEMKEKDVDFVTIDQFFDFRDDNSMGSAMRSLMLQIMSSFAEFERKIKRKRMEEGYDRALEEGKVGRPEKLNEEQRKYVIQKYKDGIPIASIKRRVNDKFDKDISRSPVDRIVSQYRNGDSDEES